MHYTVGCAPLSSFKEFRAYKPQKVPASWNWYLFRSFVVSRCDETCKHMCTKEEVFKAAQDYFEIAASKVDRSMRTEKMLSTKCLHEMVKFGGIILEDISVKPQGHASHAEMAYKDHFNDGFIRMVSLYGASERAPVIINGRLSTDHDFPTTGISYKDGNCECDLETTVLPLSPQSDNNLVQACKYVTVPVLPYCSGVRMAEPLPRWRNMPLNTVFLTEVMGADAKMEPVDLDLLCQYGEAVLHASPERSTVFGVATNLSTCRFMAVTFNIRSDGSRRYIAYCSELITKHVPDELARFVITSPESHGHRFTFPVTHFVPLAYLGSGSTGTVIAGKWCRDTADRLLPLKISVYPDTLKVERVMLSYLERQGVQHVPQIHAAAQESLSQPALCGAFCNVYTERYQPLKALTLDQAKAAWTALEALHAEHIVHRDVRMPNLMITTDLLRRVKWVDFSSARVIVGREEQASDVFIGISREELQSLYEKRPVNTASDAVLRGADTLPADEGCAMIYCVLQHLFRENHDLTHMVPHNKESFIRDRAQAFDVYELYSESAPVIARIHTALAKLGARRASLTTEEIRAEVHDGLAAAFELHTILPKEFELFPAGGT